MEVGKKTAGEQVGVSDPQGPPWQESPDVAGAVARGSLRGSSPAASCLLPSTAIQASYSFSRMESTGLTSSKRSSVGFPTGFQVTEC